MYVWVVELLIYIKVVNGIIHTRHSCIEWQAIPQRRKGQSLLNGIFGLDTFYQKLKLDVQADLA